MKQYSRVCERVDLDAIFYNFQMMKANIKDGVQMIAVIKTDGYGHGAVQIARLLEPVDYIWGYAVATLDEAVVLRKNDIKKPILVLGCIFPDQWEAMIENEVRMTTYTVEMAKGVSNLAVKMGKDAYIHIKLDTGMSRLGFQIHEDSVDAIEEISKMPGLKLEGMFTHFAKADETDKAYTDVQIGKYNYMRDELKKRGVSFPIYHCSNSAGTCRNIHLWIVSFRGGRKKECSVKTGHGTDQSCLLCKDGSGRNSGQLWRNLCDRKRDFSCDHSGRLRRWISQKSF